MKAYKTSQGNWQLNFSEGGKQKTLSLGKRFTASAAERVAKIVTEIVLCRGCGDTVPLDVVHRLESIPVRVRSSMERMGLIAGGYDMTLSELLDRFIKTKSGFLPRTISHYQQWIDHLIEFFGSDKKVSEITVKEAEKFLDCCCDHLSSCTVGRGLGTCRAFFRYAISLGIISSDPFSKLRRGQRSNECRQHFVERETIERVLSVCADDYERLIIVLARFGGLRIPSEIRELRFCDFTDKVIWIHEKTKTGAREVPFFGEIRNVFERLSCDNKQDKVFPARLVKSWVPWQMLSDRIEQAGVECWEKLFINLRSSRITELFEMGYSEKTLDAIFGNSSGVRKVHYVQFQKEKAYDKVLQDNAETLKFLSQNGGGFNMDIKNIQNEEKQCSLQDILALRDLLVSQFGTGK